MLILSRWQGQSIRIGNDVEVVVTRVGKGRVRIGIEAPPATRVLRGELDERDPPSDRSGTVH